MVCHRMCYTRTVKFVPTLKRFKLSGAALKMMIFLDLQHMKTTECIILSHRVHINKMLSSKCLEPSFISVFLRRSSKTIYFKHYHIIDGKKTNCAYTRSTQLSVRNFFSIWDRIKVTVQDFFTTVELDKEQLGSRDFPS